MVGPVERLGDRGEPPLTDLDLDRRIREQIERPLGAVTGGDQHRAIRLVDIAHRDGAEQTAPAPSCRDPCDLALEEQVAADVVRRQRARCQDFPSVWVDGA